MQVVRDPFRSTDLPRGGVGTIGNFDGVHLGHRKILEAVVARARGTGRPSFAITFEPHPMVVLRPDHAPRRIQTLRQKEEAIEAIGIETLLVIPFTRDFSLTEPEEFVRALLRDRLGASELYLGAHFAFGRGKRGDLALLTRLGAECGFAVSAVEEVLADGEPVSSTRIRRALERGGVREAGAMLGRDYELDGLVSRGDRLGHQIGVPTINLEPENELPPADGVYVTEIEIRSFGRRFQSVSNIGRRPTLYEDYTTTVETYVLDFSSDVYGDRVRLFFLDRLREERKFPSVMDLKAQIQRDIEATREYFAKRGIPPGVKDAGVYDRRVRGSHGWAEIDAERKRAIIRGIVTGRPTRGPVHAEIDVTDRCNVACYFCNQQDVRTKDQISLPHLKRLVDELAEGGLKSVRMSGGGDPLFHAGILDFLDHLDARGVLIDNLTTNGALLGPEIARRLVARGAREVIFSVNAVDDQDYHRMMQVPLGTFGRVLTNIRGLLAERGAAQLPSVVVQFLVDRDNFRKIPRMYALGRSLGADRVVISNVAAIPLGRIGEGILLGPGDALAIAPYLEEVLAADKPDKRLQLAFPIGEWNVLLEEVKRKLDYGADRETFPMAPSFREENGHCFFSWYTATIRGNGDLYPCCLLMLPDYKPLGNAVNGKFVDHWEGPAFTQMRREQREILVAGSEARFDPERHTVIRRQCVDYGLCWLKNIYFRADEAFYKELGTALDRERRRARLRALPRRIARGLRRRLLGLVRGRAA